MMPRGLEFPTSGWPTIREIRTKFNQHKGIYRYESRKGQLLYCPLSSRKSAQSASGGVPWFANREH